MRNKPLIQIVALALMGATLSVPISAVAEAKVWEVMIENMQFSPATLSVQAGDKVVWVNKDIVPHTATDASKKKAFNSKSISSGKKFSTRIKRPGSYNYSCMFHPTMKGHIEVK
jgi:plastocyanin